MIEKTSKVKIKEKANVATMWRGKIGTVLDIPPTGWPYYTIMVEWEDEGKTKRQTQLALCVDEFDPVY